MNLRGEFWNTDMPPRDADERSSIGVAGDMCSKRSDNNAVCTRPTGHSGDHVASDGEFVCERWEQKP